MESRSSEDESSLDEDVLNELPLCAIATITKLRKRNTRLKNRNQVLETELERSQAYAEELRLQVEELGEKLGRKNGEIGGECVFTQTRKEDFSSAAYLWHYGAAEPAGDGPAEPWKIPTNEPEEGEVVEELSIADQARAVCEDMVRKQGMVYEETSGLYYDYKSGYYYDAERALYYDGNSGVYYQFDSASNQYKVHSTIPPEEAAAHKELAARKEEQQKKKKSKRRQSSHSKSPDRKRSSRSKSKEKKTNGQRSSHSRSPERRRHSKSRKRSKSPDSKHSRSRDRKKRSKASGRTRSRSSSDGDKKGENKSKKNDTEKAPAPPIEQALDSINNFLDEQYSSGDETEESRIPCVRIIVKSSEDENVTAGTLYIVTCKGGSIGSKGAHEVFLQDLGCSKHHGRITFSDNKYYLRDLGSRNGTYVNGTRLSAAKQESENKEIGHGTQIQIGKSKLLCHVHPGKETCFECEPGVVKQTLEEEARQEALLSVGRGKEKVRQNRLQNLKKKYGLGKGDSVGEDKKDPNYVDRASVRRRVQGSDNPHEKTETASVDKSLGQENKGFNMLSKMGWKGGGLGKDGEGSAEPIKVELRAEKSGLGSTVPVLEVSKKSKDKADIWLKTQKRFGNTPLLPAFNVESEEDDAS